MRFRSWIVTTLVIGIALAVLSVLLVLQHNALYSALLRQRIAVIAQTTAETFRPVLDLGLPITMLRDGDKIVARGIAIDPEIVAVHAINPTGIVAYTTGTKPLQLSQEVLTAMRLADRDAWGHETADMIYSGFSIHRETGGPLSGAVVVEYPHGPLETASQNIVRVTLHSAILILIGTSVLAYILIYLVLDRPQRRLAALLRAYRQGQALEATASPDRSQKHGGLDAELSQLARSLHDADEAYGKAQRAIGAFAEGQPVSPTHRHGHSEEAAPGQPGRLKALILARVLPITIVLLVASALMLGTVVMRAVTRSIEPELAARTDLIGTVVSENVQRALESGIALDEIVGADRYFGDMLERLPEVAYIAIATGRIVIEAGERIDPYLAPPRERRGVRSHPILRDEEEVAYVVIDIDPRLIAQRFRDVFLDAAVILLVTILLAWEAMLLLTGRTLTGGLARLQRLSAMQAACDFSKRVAGNGKDSIQAILSNMSERAEALHESCARAIETAAAPSRHALEQIGTRFGLSPGGPKLLETSSFSDIRLALFLFAAADELPLAFLPIYTRSADNIWPWLDQSVLISLPLAGYLLAIVLMSPYARVLVERFGVRGLFFAAALPTLAAHIGLFAASTAQEIILWRAVTGFGYALVTLAAQDYVLSVATRADRDRMLGIFSLVLFGGVFSGVALGGVLADRLGPSNVFLVSATLIAVSALLSRWLIAPGIGKTHSQQETATDRTSKWRVLADARLFALIFCIAIPGAVVLQAFVSYLVALTLNANGASAAEIGRILMLYFITVMAISPLAGRLEELLRLPGAVLCLAGAAFAGLALLPVAMAPSQLTMAVAMIGTGAGGALVRGTQVSLALSLSESNVAGPGPTAVLGALRTGERLGSIVGLVFLAWLSGVSGYTAATLAIAVWTLAGGALFAIMGGKEFLTKRWTSQ